MKSEKMYGVNGGENVGRKSWAAWQCANGSYKSNNLWGGEIQPMWKSVSMKLALKINEGWLRVDTENVVTYENVTKSEAVLMPVKV